MIAIEEYIQQKILDALKKLGYFQDDLTIKLERPKQEAYGDWASNVAMQLASVAKKNPGLIAQEIVKHIDIDGVLIEKLDIAGAGFINFYLGWGYYRLAAQNIIQKETKYGVSNWGQDAKIQIEFVSANPTGPLNVVSARAAAVGDVMANLYNAVGFQCDREYYINDAGRQIKLLGASVSSRYMALFDEMEEFPEEGYHGEYIKDLAESIAGEFNDKFVNLSVEQRHDELSCIAMEMMVNLQKKNMFEYRVRFDTWFSESQLREKDEHVDVLEKLKQSGYIFKKEGAVWFKSEQFGDEKDRVLITSDGEPTYFMVDIAYHRNKYGRGYEKLYDIWGPDHHGYIPRMKAALQALGYSKDSFEVEIVQQVNLLRGGEVVKMSKRAGRIIEMQELIDEVGVDAARFFFINRKSSSHLDFDIDLAKKQSDENPVFYVQYAHARVFNIIKFGAEQGINIDESVDLNLLDKDEEKQLIRKLLQYPEVISKAAQFWEPHRLTNYLQELASTFHHFYHIHRVVTDDVALSKARLSLCKATQIVFANGLKILGINAPERM